MLISAVFITGAIEVYCRFQYSSFIYFAKFLKLPGLLLRHLYHQRTLYIMARTSTVWFFLIDEID